MKESSDEEYNPEKYYINLKNVQIVKDDQYCQNDSNETDSQAVLKETQYNQGGYSTN